MITKIIEATNGERNWGKFLLGQFSAAELLHPSSVCGNLSFGLIRSCGHSEYDTLVLDLQTCEGAIFTPGGNAAADLAKHRIWVCVLYEPFLVWLWTRAEGQRLRLDALPDVIDLPDAPFAFAGYRRTGPDHE